MKNRCKKVEKLFGVYIYNAVTASERAYVENHISQCPKCAEELSSRQKALVALKPHDETGEMPQRIQDDFALNVYKKIALDSLKHQSRQVRFRRFVLQPSFAAIIILFGITAFFLRYHPGQVTKITQEQTSVAVKTEEGTKKELRASIYMNEFFQREGETYKSKPEPVKPTKLAEAKAETPEAQKPPQEISDLMASGLTPDPKSLLEEANFIHFSLGDRKRALAQYQKLVDNYPNTEAAEAAGEMIKSIRDFEYRVQNENLSVQTIDLEI